MKEVPMRQLAEASAEVLHQALLEVAEAIAQHRDLRELVHELAARLHGVLEFDFLSLILHDSRNNGMKLHILETDQPKKIQPGAEFSVEDTPAGFVWETQQPFLMEDTENE